MVQSVELLLDPAADAAVREQWSVLAAAGLPSQARHSGDSNAPHVTLAARDAIDPAVEPGLRAAVAAGLPLPVRLGALTVFGRHRYILVRLVVADVRLLALQAEVVAALGPDPAPGRDLLAPGRWTPHVTLAHRLSADQVGVALSALGGAGEADADGVDCRRWDADERRTWSLLDGQSTAR